MAPSHFLSDEDEDHSCSSLLSISPSANANGRESNGGESANRTTDADQKSATSTSAARFNNTTQHVNDLSPPFAAVNPYNGMFAKAPGAQSQAKATSGLPHDKVSSVQCAKNDSACNGTLLPHINGISGGQRIQSVQ